MEANSNYLRHTTLAPKPAPTRTNIAIDPSKCGTGTPK